MLVEATGVSYRKAPTLFLALSLSNRVPRVPLKGSIRVTIRDSIRVLYTIGA